MSGWREPDFPLRLGISTCLLGENVRFDGGHKRDAFLVDTFGKWVEWVPVCPEVEVGMPTPRESLRLVREGDAVRMVAPRSGTDHTEAMRRWARRRVRELEGAELCGYVLKRASPSCGMERVKVYGATGAPRKDGVGLYAQALMERFGLLPVEEEGRLCDPRLRENFVERVFAYRRVRALFRGRWKVRDLVEFHTAHKFQLLAHSPQAYQELGRLVAGAKALGRAEVRDRYQGLFMEGLRAIATTRRNTNVLQHLAGFLREHLDTASRSELTELIHDYHRGLVPLIVPVTLLRHHVRRFEVSYLQGQLYLEPHPKELMLRNHV